MKAHKLPQDSHRLRNQEAPALEDVRALESRRRQREAWLAENREAIAAYNELVARSGVFSSGLRGF